MNKSLRYKIIIVILVFIASVWALYPTLRIITMDPERKKAIEVEDPEAYDKLHDKAIKPGLDLSGGMHLVLEVDDTKLEEGERADVVDRALEIIRNRVDQFGVSEPDIKKEGSKRIIVQLPGLQDPARARRLIGETAMLEWRLVRQVSEVADVIRRLDDALRREMKGAADSAADSSSAVQTGEEESPSPIEPLALPGDSAAADSAALPVPGSEALAEIPVAADAVNKPFSSLITNFYRDWIAVGEENIPRIRQLLSSSEAQRVIPKDSEFLWLDEWVTMPDNTRGKFLFLVALDEMVSGKNLQNAFPSANPDTPNQLIIRFEFNRTGARELSRFTGKYTGRFTAIVLDGKIKSYPVIRTKIPDGRGFIEGSFTDVEARDLAVVLRAGALPADLIPREERTVGPSLGSDSIRMGIRAAIMGLITVALFMIVYYKLSGVIATVTLMFNLIILFAMLAYLRATLTLPGIAGIILTIGMAVDANVLIYERIREELRKEKTVRSAIDAGYDRAFVTILDSNLTTLITAAVLWQFGTGPVKGFATTLSMGIVGSMFTALVFSRMIFDLWTKSGKVQKLSI